MLLLPVTYQSARPSRASNGDVVMWTDFAASGGGALTVIQNKYWREARLV